MKERLTQILEALSDGVYAHAFTNKTSLYVGRAGSVLLFDALYRHTQEEKYFDYFSNSFGDVFQTLQQEKKVDASLGNGIAGLGWLLQSLVKHGTVDASHEHILQWFDKQIADAIALDQRDKNYDLIYGLIGKGVYFLERFPQGESAKVLEVIVDVLMDMAEQCADGFRWRNSYQEGYNLGLAHGIPSILIFLCRAWNSGAVQQSEKLKHAITQTSRWLLNRRESFAYGSYTYSVKDAESKTECSRLAWCYGDYGVALALLRAAQTLQDVALRKTAIDIARIAAKRTLENSGIERDRTNGHIDATFCHGIAGVGYLSEKFFRETNHEDFQKASSYWFNELIASRKEGEGHTGFFRYTPAGWREDGGLVEGVTGIGLVLFYFLADTESNWEALFLTN